MLSRHLWLAVLVVFVGVGIPGDARAKPKVDWSEYLEPPGARPMKVKTSERVAAPEPRAKEAKGKAAKAKTAERAKAKAKKKKGRRR
ncbi:MAG: hypothetical protein H0T46_17880 [Deltaproteobacteria bacterium]|nr:hypothetical protein [Deltaproteobacteria bacterium]